MRVLKWSVLSDAVSAACVFLSYRFHCGTFCCSPTDCEVILVELEREDLRQWKSRGSKCGVKWTWFSM